jgi:hypothetical protein
MSRLCETHLLVHAAIQVTDVSYILGCSPAIVSEVADDPNGDFPCHGRMEA